MPQLSRRSILTGMLSVAMPAVAEDPESCPQVRSPNGWCAEEFQGKTVHYRGTGPTVVLLHELNGLSPGCVDFGTELACHGYKVFMPKLFGHPMQDNIVFGAIEACLGGFSCYATAKDSSVSKWLRAFVENLGTRTLDGRGIGVIGMCLTGALPLGVMKGTKVRAVVMSQPALPFGKGKDESVGVSERTILDAKESGVPILGFRFKADKLCTGKRFEYLKGRFGEDQFHGHELCTPAGFHPDGTHRAHAVLTGLFGEKKAWARKKVLELMDANLR